MKFFDSNANDLSNRFFNVRNNDFEIKFRENESDKNFKNFYNVSSDEIEKNFTITTTKFTTISTLIF